MRFGSLDSVGEAELTMYSFRITLSTILDNPAPLVLHTNDASFEVIYKGTQVGRAYINPLDLYKGSNTLPTEFHYQPANPGDATAEDLLTQYLETKGQIPLTIQGDGSSTPYGSLKEAFTGVHLETSFPGQGIPLVHDIQIFVDFVTAFCNNTATFDFRVRLVVSFDRLPQLLTLANARRSTTT